MANIYVNTQTFFIVVGTDYFICIHSIKEIYQRKVIVEWSIYTIHITHVLIC